MNKADNEVLELRAENARLRAYADELEDDLAMTSWPDHAGEAAMREALERLMSVDFLEWEASAGGTPCEDWYEILEGAKAVLASDTGLPLLERLRTAERERDKARAALSVMYDVQKAIVER